jgi:hypothetical protein
LIGKTKALFQNEFSLRSFRLNIKEYWTHTSFIFFQAQILRIHKSTKIPILAGQQNLRSASTAQHRACFINGNKYWFVSEIGGSLLNCPIVEELLPHFRQEAPFERHVVKWTLCLLSDSSASSDGVVSLLAKKAGLRKSPEPHALALGVKALFRLKEEEINERFGLVRDQGCSQEFIGCTKGIRGGGFIYTQTQTLSAGLVLHLDSLKKSGFPPYDLFEEFLAFDPARKLLKGARLVEYSAHMIPEGGYRQVPRLFADGMLLAGDAAGLC